MKNIIFLTFLNLWSMDQGKGAPSFYKTIEGFINDGWNVILINPDYNIGLTPSMKGLTVYSYKPIFYPLCRLRKIGIIGRLLHSFHGSVKLYQLGNKIIKELDNKALIYSYEVDGVKPGKRLSQKYHLPFVTRFQGTILAPVENNLMNRIKRYPHFQALAESANITIMTDDGTLGDVVLRNLNNHSQQVYFWRNGVDIQKDAPRNEDKIQVIREKYNLSDGDHILVTVSRLASWKKVNRAIEALSIVSKKRDDIKLVIVGDGDEKQNLMQLADGLGVASKVIFTGSVEQADVKHFLDMADIFLSLYDLSNVGNPLLEAMACGKPIITLNVGNTKSIIRHEENGILLDIDDLNQIPYYIDKILNSKAYAERLGKEAKDYADNNFWTWNERIDAELKAVNELYIKSF